MPPPLTPIPFIRLWQQMMSSIQHDIIYIYISYWLSTATYRLIDKIIYPLLTNLKQPLVFLTLWLSSLSCFCLQVSSTIKCFSPASAMFWTHHAWSVQTASFALLNAPLSSVKLKLTDWTWTQPVCCSHHRNQELTVVGVQNRWI